MQAWEDVRSQHSIGLSSSNDFGTSFSHVVSRDDRAFSTSGFEALGVGCNGNFFEALSGVCP